MGQRANLVIVRQSGYELYYDHWCANTLPQDLFWGPKYAASFIEAQSKVDESGWLDDVWAEGGVVLDEERKLLLFYGGEDELYDIPYRRVFMSLMETLWKDWKLQWAYEGILDIASYVEVPREKVLASGNDDLSNISLEPPEEKDWVDTIASLKDEDDESLIFPLSGGIEGYLLNGPRIVVECDRAFGHKRLSLDEWTTTFPTSGFHIDVALKVIDIWHADTTANIVRRIQEKWPGWEIREHHDQYEVQLMRTEGNLHLQPVDLNEILIKIKSSLMRKASNPLDSFSNLINRLQEEDKNVEVSPSAFMHGYYEVPEAVREKKFHYAMDVLLKQSKFKRLRKQNDKSLNAVQKIIKKIESLKSWG